MAAAPHRDRDGSLNNDGGGQGYGKFRKQPYRRATKATPYDRPPSAVRNPGNGSLHGQGWLSKLVHPAHRLITSSAFQLFGLVFRKSLPPPPPPQSPERRELSPGDMEKQPSDLGSAGQFGKQAEDVNERDNPSNSSSSGGVSELELILKQKIFTRSEIDHLSAILLSRVPGGDEEKRPDLIHSRAAVPQDQKEFPNNSLGHNGVERNLESAPTSDSRVLDEDVASPAELAKAYMSRRSLMGSPSKQEFSNQPLRDNSTALMNHPFTARSQMPSFMPSSSGRAVFSENGFVTPRSQGRTAIYSMARTPYSRVLSASGLQNSGVRVDAFGELPSSSQNSWENNRFSGSKQGALKRRSSALDSYIGSVGPIRRIRQKSNLLPSSKNFSVRRDGFVSDVPQQPSSVEKSFLVGESSKGNGGNNINRSGANPVPSKSREVASKILQQLDVLVSPREKSPTKLSPSMLSGPALRSLDNADSSRFLENLDVKHGNLLPDPRGMQPQAVEKTEQNGQEKPSASFDKSAASIHGADSTNLVKKDIPGLKATVIPVIDTVSESSLQKSRGFQMSAHEDFLELDGGVNSQEILPATKSGRSGKPETVLVEKETTSIDVAGVEKPPSFPESIVSEKSDDLIIPVTSPSTIVDQQAVTESRSKMLSVKTTLPEKSDTYAFAEKVIPVKALNYASRTPNSSNSVGNEAPLLKFSSTVAENDLAGRKAQGWLKSSAPVFSGKTDSARKKVELEKDDNKNIMKARVLGRPPEPAVSAVATLSSTANIFSSGISSSSNQNSGSMASTSISFSIPPLVSNNVNRNSSYISSGTLATSTRDATAVTSSASNANSSSSLSTSVSSLLFKFGSSAVPPTSFSSGQASSMTGSTEAETKKASLDIGTSSAITSMGATNSMFTSTGGNLFGGTSAITITGDVSSTITSTGGNFFGGISAFTNTGINSFSSAPSSVITSSGSSTINGMPSAISSTGSNGSVAITSSGISNVSGASSAVTHAPSSIFGFSSDLTATTTANQSQGFNPFGASSVLISSAASSQSMPLQLSSSAPSPSHTLAQNATISVGSSIPNSSASGTLFSSNATFGLNSSSASASDSVSSSNSVTPVFGSSWLGPKSPPSLSTPTLSSSSSSLSAAFSFGASTSANPPSTSTHGLFGSSFNPSSSGSPFSFSSPATSTLAQPVLGNLNPSFAFGSSHSNNSDQITMEDNMAEDPVQASSSPVPIFGQQSSPGFTLGLTSPLAGNQSGSTALPSANPFQFSGQPTSVAPQNPSPFQAYGSFNGGGNSFSLGAGGDDKSQRRIFKAKRHQRKK